MKPSTFVSVTLNLDFLWNMKNFFGLTGKSVMLGWQHKQKKEKDIHEILNYYIKNWHNYFRNNQTKDLKDITEICNKKNWYWGQKCVPGSVLGFSGPLTLCRGAQVFCRHGSCRTGSSCHAGNMNTYRLFSHICVHVNKDVTFFCVNDEDKV